MRRVASKLAPTGRVGVVSMLAPTGRVGASLLATKRPIHPVATVLPGDCVKLASRRHPAPAKESCPRTPTVVPRPNAALGSNA